MEININSMYELYVIHCSFTLICVKLESIMFMYFHILSY